MIYLDHAAATPLSEKAKTAMLPFFSDQFFNPSSAYLPAVAVRKLYEQAKSDIAHVIGAKGVDLVMTSGATESINLAFLLLEDLDAEVLISATEHPAVLENARRYKNHQIVAVDTNGCLDLDDFTKKLTKNTQFISVCLASSELGAIQPISDLSRLVAKERERRALNGEKTPLYFHCDASQGIGFLGVKINRLGVDLLTLNGAKLYGPKGIGALYVGHNVKLKAQVLGGGQEMGLRSGTENVPAVVAFAAAIKEAEDHLASEQKRLAKLKQQLRSDLADLPGIKFLGNPKHQLVNFLPISLPGLDAERLIFMLEEREVYLSTGAACSASKGIKSPSLQAIGLSDSEIAGSLRLTLGRLNDSENLKQASFHLHAVVAEESARLTKTSPSPPALLDSPKTARLVSPQSPQKLPPEVEQ
ncbi:cysteine desulfurase [Candidatus Saccharibacteria bacterium]|nr:cysteine desulfurase [Candidatus Saccharibacteria bacterium]